MITTTRNKVEKKPKTRFETSPTHLSGVQLRREPDVKLDILRKTISKLYQLARNFVQTKWQIDDLTRKQNSRRDEIIGIAKSKEHYGLRGIISKKDNFVLTVSPKESIKWDQEKLRSSLGIVYHTMVRENLVVQISIPVGFVTQGKGVISEEIVAKAIREALTNLGIPSEDLAKFMRHTVDITVDEEMLNEMAEQRRIKLPKGTKTSEVTWSVKVDPLRKDGKTIESSS